MSTLVAAFFVAMLYVGLRATQQRHVQHEQYWRMPAISLLMGYCDIFLVASAIHLSDDSGFWSMFWLATVIGLGSGIGSMLGTYLHARRRK